MDERGAHRSCLRSEWLCHAERNHRHNLQQGFFVSGTSFRKRSRLAYVVDWSNVVPCHDETSSESNVRSTENKSTTIELNLNEGHFLRGFLIFLRLLDFVFGIFRFT